MPDSISRYNGAYQGSGEVIRDTTYSIAIRDGNEVHVFFKGTGSGETRAERLHEWWEDGEATVGMRITAWDKELQYYIDNYGFQSDTVTYTGFSRGGALARYMGGTGYGSATWSQYPPREGSQSVQSGYTWNAWQAFNAWAHNEFVMPTSSDVATVMGVTGRGQMEGAPHQSIVVGSHIPTGKRGRSDMHAADAAHEPKRQKTNPAVSVQGSFAGLVTTFLEPTTGLILNYKGIPSRKRKYNSLERYSPFWKEHNRLTQTSVLAGPS